MQTLAAGGQAEFHHLLEGRPIHGGGFPDGGVEVAVVDILHQLAEGDGGQGAEEEEGLGLRLAFPALADLEIAHRVGGEERIKYLGGVPGLAGEQSLRAPSGHHISGDRSQQFPGLPHKGQQERGVRLRTQGTGGAALGIGHGLDDAGGEPPPKGGPLGQMAVEGGHFLQGHAAGEDDAHLLLRQPVQILAEDGQLGTGDLVQTVQQQNGTARSELRGRVEGVAEIVLQGFGGADGPGRVHLGQWEVQNSKMLGFLLQILQGSGLSRAGNGGFSLAVEENPGGTGIRRNEAEQRGGANGSGVLKGEPLQPQFGQQCAVDAAPGVKAGGADGRCGGNLRHQPVVDVSLQGECPFASQIGAQEHRSDRQQSQPFFRGAVPDGRLPVGDEVEQQVAGEGGQPLPAGVAVGDESADVVCHLIQHLACDGRRFFQKISHTNGAVVEEQRVKAVAPGLFRTRGTVRFIGGDHCIGGQNGIPEQRVQKGMAVVPSQFP